MFKIIRLKCLLLLTICVASLNIHADPVKFDNLTILVSSCDKYSPLWDPFFTLMFKEWPSLKQENSNVPIMLIANKMSFADPRVKTINIPNEKSWSDNLITALDQVQTKYVMLALDDYWINKPVNETRLLEIFNAMQKEDAAMLKVSVNDPRWQPSTKHPTVQHLLYNDKFQHYKAALQLAIWDKEALKFLLRPGENPWVFELNGTARSHGYPKTFLGLSGDEPIEYLNAAQQGYVNQYAVDYVKQNGIPFEAGNLPILDRKNYKLYYALWKGRVKKVFNIVMNPRKHFDSYYPYHIDPPSK